MGLTVVEVVKDVDVDVTRMKVTIEVEVDTVTETDSVTGIVAVVVQTWRVRVYGRTVVGSAVDTIVSVVVVEYVLSVREAVVVVVDVKLEKSELVDVG